MDSSGELSSTFLTAAVLTLPGSWILLSAYRRFVDRAIRRSQSSQPGPTRSASAVLRQADTAGSLSTIGSESLLRRRIATVYGGASLLCGLAASIVYFATMRGVEFRMFSLLVFAYALAWPIVPVVATLLRARLRGAIDMALFYLLTGAFLIFSWSSFALVVLRNTEAAPVGNVLNFGRVLAMYAGPPLLVMAVAATRRLRPVSPLLLSGLLVFSFGALLMEAAFVRALDYAPLRSVSSQATLLVVFLIASLPVGYVCWRLQRWLGSLYQNKRFSDAQLVADAWWAVALFWFSFDLSVEIGWWGSSALLLFFFYRGLVEVGLRLWPVSNRRPTPSRLLVLRVFGAKGAEQLFDAVTERWRFMGSVQLIGAADLALRTIDPGDMLTFLAGRTDAQFVRGPEDVVPRMATLDLERDPDGCFRVNDVFCFESGWQPTVVSLLGKSDVILMDLRGFSTQNQGVLFELGKLVEHRLLERTLFVADAHTDEALLSVTLNQAASRLRLPAIPAVRVARVSGVGRRALDGILEELGALRRASVPAPAGAPVPVGSA